MSEPLEPERRVGATSAVEHHEGEAGATPGRSTRAQHEGGMFSGGEQWESLGEASPAEPDANAELAAALSSMGPQQGVHKCYSGCVHDQFDRMMTASAEQQAFKIAPGAIEEAARRAGGKPADEKKGAPLPTDGAKTDAGDQVGHAGTVTDGKPSGFPGVLGLATWNYGKFTYPKLELESAKQPDKSYNTTIKPTTSKDAATSAVATPVGTYNIGQQTIQNPDTNKNVNMKKILDVDAAAAGQIKAAEQEHLDDVTQAYTITLKAAEDAVNANAGPFNAPKKADAEKAAKDAVKGALDPKLGANPRTWSSMLQTAANLTRSNRDAKKWHTFNYTAQANDIDFSAKTVTYHVDNNPNVGSVSSADLIKL